MQITSTTYMDFLLRTGLARLRVVKEARRQYDGEYAQGGDYYRRLREGIISMLRDGGDATRLWEIVEASPSEKHKNFTAAANGFEKWMRGKGIVWGSRPQRHYWEHGGLTVIVNPELRMNVDGEPYRVKLYFKPAPIRQVGANLVIHLHELAGFETENVGVLDVRAGKLFSKSRTSDDYAKVLRAEALSFVAMWNAVGQQAAEGDAIS